MNYIKFVWNTTKPFWFDIVRIKNADNNFIHFELYCFGITLGKQEY